MTDLRITNRRLHRPLAVASVALGAGLALGMLPAVSAQAQGADYAPNGIELDRIFDIPAYLTGLHRDTGAEGQGPLSTFTVFPRFDVDVSSTDNLYSTNTGTASDVLIAYRPSLDIRSDWDNHQLAFSASLEDGNHQNNPGEDYTDYTLSAGGGVSIDEGLSGSASLGYSQGHGQRGEIDDPGSSFGPTISHTLSFSLGAQYAMPDGLQLSPVYQFTGTRVEDNGTIDNSDRDTAEHTYRARVGWEVSPGTVLFVQPSYGETIYRRRLDDFGKIRDSQSYEMSAGITWDVTGVTFVDFLMGWTRKTFDEPSFADSNDFLARGNVRWDATDLLTFTASLDQSFTAAATQGASGTLSRAFNSQLDWDVADSFKANASFGYTLEDIKGSTDARTRDIYLYGIGASWLVNEYLSGGANLSHREQMGDLAADQVTENRISIRLGGQL